MSHLRIRGLVKAERYVRERVAGALSKQAAAELRAYVKSVIHSVDEICTSHGTTVSQLPAPSRKAYEYLTSLRVRASRRPKSPPPQTARKPVPPPENGTRIQLKNVVKMVASALNTVSDLAGDMSRDTVAEMVEPYITDSVRMVEQACRKRGGTPADLPAPSRRAYGMLALLSSRETLRQYVETVSAVKNLFAAANSGGKGFQVRLDDQNGIYHLRRQQGERFLRLSPGFLAADTEMLEIVVNDALNGRDADRWRRVQEFVHSDEFLEIRRSMEERQNNTSRAQGTAYDLMEICDRVRHEHFNGDLEPPVSLSWTQSQTYRTFGQYSSILDRITISRSLDSDRVPRYVIEFVMYHELLHKYHGIGLRESGRRAIHTPAFRKDEKRFPKYEESKQFLSKLAARLRS